MFIKAEYPKDGLRPGMTKDSGGWTNILGAERSRSPQPRASECSLRLHSGNRVGAVMLTSSRTPLNRHPSHHFSNAFRSCILLLFSAFPIGRLLMLPFSFGSTLGSAFPDKRLYLY